MVLDSASRERLFALVAEKGLNRLFLAACSAHVGYAVHHFDSYLELP